MAFSANVSYTASFVFTSMHLQTAFLRCQEWSPCLRESYVIVDNMGPPEWISERSTMNHPTSDSFKSLLEPCWDQTSILVIGIKEYRNHFKYEQFWNTQVKSGIFCLVTLPALLRAKRNKKKKKEKGALLRCKGTHVRNLNHDQSHQNSLETPHVPPAD